MRNVIEAMTVALGLLLAVVGAQAATPGGAVGRDFNHAMTGFALSGSHAAAACETCHVGGVFKGTPRNCDECHATGRHIVATPKSPNHIVTTAQCDSCHFNTVTFLGARFNHGTAKPGECNTCHNGRIARGKHATHIPTALANDRCDACHRSSAWVPASWNHNGVTGDCVTCHKPGGPGRDKSAGHLPMSMGVTPVTISSCRSCHTNYYSFYRAFYDHAGAGVNCGNCHATGNSYGGRIAQMTSQIHTAATNVSIISGSNGCTSCHNYNYSSWGGARYNHADAAYNAKMGNGSCGGCHSGNNPPIRSIPANHTRAFAANLVVSNGTNCQLCHTVTSTWAQMNHSAGLVRGGAPCKNCHDSGLNPGQYFAGMRQKANGHKNYNNATQDCISCHALNYQTWGD